MELRPDSARVAVAAVAPRAAAGLSIRSAELIAVMGAALGFSIVVWHHDRVAWWPAAGWFAAIAMAPLLLRAIEARFPASRAARFVADFAPTGYFFALYFNLNPVADAVNLGIADDMLIRADIRIFGDSLPVLLDGKIPPLLNDIFLGAYTTHFLWPLILGLVLWFRGKHEAFDEYLTALLFFVIVNYALYVSVPVMGPRYFQSGRFDGLVPGLLGIAPWVDGAFRDVSFARDCFPSGHTGLALLVLVTSYRHVRPLFWVALPVLVSLIAGTVAGRFHYGTDLLASLPLLLVSLAVARQLRLRRPAGFSLSSAEVAAVLRKPTLRPDR